VKFHGTRLHSRVNSKLGYTTTWKTYLWAFLIPQPWVKQLHELFVVTIIFWMSLGEVLGAIANAKEFHDPHATPTHFINNKGRSRANWWNKIQSPHWTEEIAPMHKPSLFILWKTRSCCLECPKKQGPHTKHVISFTDSKFGELKNEDV
jgi:hypothetical protein